MQSIELTTERLRLRAPIEDDVDAITDACQDPAIQRYTTVPTPYRRRHAEEFVGMVAAGWAAGTDVVWAIHLDDALVGMIGMHHIKDGVAEIGFWAVASARGKGVLKEAALAVVAWGFEGPLALHRIGWRAVAGNVASARLARALGIRYEGTLRGEFLHAGHRDDSWIGGVLATDDRTPVAWPVL